MFGGGVEAGEPDPTLPIRGTSIRGQLQFWWRATRGASYSTREELFKEHAGVWGTTEQASPVAIEVRDIQVGTARPCLKYSARNDGKLQPIWEKPFNNRGCSLPYALFPFQGQLTKDRRQVEKNPAHFIENGSFTLRISYPEALRQDVETAVWAWINFGGLGARTRRGCGALFCEELAPKDVAQIGEQFKSACLAVGAGRLWPTLPASLLIHPETGASVARWDWLIGRFRHFRQGEKIAREPGPGRSRYPEPDTIRRITGMSSRGHEPRGKIPDGFPRAEFGLPIIFHFKDERTDDPFDTALYPFFQEMTSNGPRLEEQGFPLGETKDRMASPVILKPLALLNGQAVPLILPLLTSGVSRVELQNNRTRECLTQRRTVPVRDPSFASGDSPINGRSTKGSALESFLAFAKNENGFQEVTR